MDCFVFLSQLTLTKSQDKDLCVQGVSFFFFSYFSHQKMAAQSLTE